MEQRHATISALVWVCATCTNELLELYVSYYPGVPPKCTKDTNVRSQTSQETGFASICVGANECLSISLMQWAFSRAPEEESTGTAEIAPSQYLQKRPNSRLYTSILPLNRARTDAYLGQDGYCWSSMSSMSCHLAAYSAPVCKEVGETANNPDAK